MKQVLLSALGLLGFAMCFAQNPVVYEDDQVQVIDSIQVSVEQMVDSVFAHVDLSQVPSGILIDKTLSTLDYSNFTGQPDLPDTADLRKWRHLYNVFYRNAINEAQKWQPDLQDSLAVMDSLMRIRDLPGEKTSATLACNLLVNNPQNWKMQYERLRTNVLEAAEQYPPKLPRIRKWITHVDGMLQDIYAVEADSNFTVLNDSNRVDFLSWSQLYHLINQAAINPKQQPLPELDKVLNPFLAEGQPVPIVFLDMQYHRIRPDAIEKNLLRFSGIQLHDVAGRSESPYEAMTFLAATPATLMLENTSQTFIIHPELMFGNQQKAIKSIAIDFGDGLGFREVNFNEPINIQYAGSGEKRMLFKITYEDCSFALSHSAIIINEENNTTNGRIMRTQDFRGMPDETFPIRAERPYEGGFASGHVSIEYGCGNDRLMKPLIIVEGFNPDQFEILEQASNYQTFLNSIPNTAENPLLNNLQNSGYDLVYLDYDDGGTYIQRNAYLLQTLIKEINEMKEANGSTEPNVVMGISMGGLVSRYALADMERQGEAHDTRLFISFDSPHQGANVPLGFQYAAYHLPHIRILGNSTQKLYEGIKKQFPDLDIPSPNIGVQLAETPAARQMLILHAFPAYREEHQRFMEEYREFGYPKNCRNVAIANGSQTGVGQGFEPGDRLLHLQSSGFRATNYTIASLLLNWANKPDAYQEKLPRHIVAGAGVLLAYAAYGYQADIQVNAVQDYSDRFQKVYQTFITGRVLFLPISLNFYQVKVKGVPPLDSAPGGRSNYGGDLSNVFRDDFGTGSFCFIPTVSALDIREAVPAELTLNVQNANIIANARTAFLDYDAPNAAFTAPDNRTLNNEFHTAFTGFNARLLQRELVGAGLPDNFLSRESYNFGAGSTLSTTHRMSDMIISTGGQLLVNANIPIGPGQDAGENPPPLPNTTFEVIVSPQDNCNFRAGEVEVRRGGEIILGETNPNNKGILRFSQGTTLILESGSRLVIHENSQLIIACGATLIFEEGAVIETEGDDSRLIVDGQLQLKEDTVFPYAYTTTGNASSPDVTGITIDGPGLLCNAGGTYQLSNLPDGTEVCWSVEGSNIILEENNACSNSVNIKASASTVSGTGTITASVRYVGACDDIAPSVVTRTVALGVLTPSDIIITGGETVCPNSQYTFKASPENQQGYQWSVAGLGTIISGQGTNSITVSTNESASGSVSVAIDNGCGYGHEANRTLTACNTVTFQTYPVPSSDYLNVDIASSFEAESTEISAMPDEYEIKLYNDHSMLIKQMKTKNKQVKIDVSDLPPKVYLLQVSYKGKSTSRKVMIGKL